MDRTHRRKTLLWSLAALVTVVVAARVAAPYLVLRYVNRTLDDLEGYSGRVADVDLHLWRGAYRVEGIRVFKTDSPVETPTLQLRTLDISVQWKALLDGAIVAELDLHYPEVNFVVTPSSDDATQVEGASNWKKQVKDLVPLRINRVGIHAGQVHYRDAHSEPKVDAYLQDIEATVSNLTNSEELSKSLAADLDLTARAMGSGAFSIHGRIDPFSERPTFDIEAELEGLQLNQLDDLLRAYANVDVEAGTIDLYTQMRARKGELEGYAKPFLKDLDVLQWREEEEGVLGKAWEGLVGVGAELLENQGRSTTATRIPLSGQLDAPDADVWSTIASLLRHAFIDALDRGLRDGLEEDA